MSKTVDEVRQLRDKLEKDITKLLLDFEAESGVKVDSLYTTHIDDVGGSKEKILISSSVKIKY